MVPLLVVVEGLDAEDVPGAEELALGLVPDRKGEHAPQLLEDLLAVLLIAVEDGLAVGLGAEGVALLQQVLPELLIVVDLPVEHQHHGAVLIEDGLPPALQVDDGQPPESQGDVVVHIVVGVVRAPVDDSVGHLLDDPLAVDIRRIEKAYKAAHGVCSFQTSLSYSRRRGAPQASTQRLASTSRASR